MSDILELNECKVEVLEEASLNENVTWTNLALKTLNEV
jgi:hypothetical protein